MNKNDSTISGNKYKKIEHLSVRNLFLFTTVIGAFAIFFGVHLKSNLMSISLPLIIMFSYIFIVEKMDSDLPKTIIGDSYYYLGFIFTLVALVSSLISLANNDNININSIIGSFGAALTTTIVGLIARLFITSFSVQSQMRKEQLDSEIELSLEKFIAQIETLTDISRESLIKIHYSTEDTLTKTLNKYEEVNTNITDSITNLSQRINNIDIQKDLISKPIGIEIDELVGTIKKHKISYVNINKLIVKSSELLTKQFSQSDELITTHIENFENSLVGVIKKQSLSYEKTLEEISSGILTSIGEIKDTKIDTEDSINRELKNLEDHIKHISSSFDEMDSIARNSLANNIKVSEQNILSAETISKSATKLDLVVNNVNDSFKDSELVKQSLLDMSDVIFNLNNSLTETIKAAGLAKHSLSSISNVTDATSEQLVNDISEVYSQLANRIKEIRDVS